MAKLFEQSAGHLIFRRPDGYVALDTRKPMPARIGSLNVTNLTVDFPKTPGEQLKAEGYTQPVFHIKYHTITPAYSGRVKQIDLGAFTGSVQPSIIYGRVRIRRTLQGGNVTGHLEAPLATNEWLQWPGGSLLLEHFGQASKIWMWRHLDIEVSGGRWRLNCRQGNDYYDTEESLSIVAQSTQSTFQIDLALEWGVFR